ncbi:MAG TPA: hypothetical protein VKY92_01320, partial [Verrucomicrobiae bacterium]|nr:hypothetical protein [Verrucomicrobiae bacterium]
MDNPKEAPKSLLALLARLSSHPLFGITGWIGTMLGVVLFFVFQEKPKLTFAINPVRTPLVRAGETSQLKVTFSGREITNDVTAVQVALWNAGRRPIRASEILEPVTLAISRAQILEVTIRRVSRQLVGFKFDAGRFQDGGLQLGWNILERGDGASLQIIYAGPESLPVTFHGVVEGQSSINAGTWTSPPPSPKTVLKLLAACLLLGFLSIKLVRSEDRLKERVQPDRS